MSVRLGHIHSSSSMFIEFIFGGEILGMFGDSLIRLFPGESFHGWTFNQLRKVGFGTFRFNDNE